ncbi:MAG: DUF427 domain-containing protein [Nakamurella sp.]
MAISMTKHIMQILPALRYQPTPKRVRVSLGETRVADSRHAMLVWEPMRVVPSYAVPAADILVPLLPGPPAATAELREIGFGEGGPRLLDPSVPFEVHTAAGDPKIVVAQGRTGQAFWFEDPDLDGYVELDFDGFDWWEEDEPIMGHPRDPFHRIDIRHSSQQVRLEYNGAIVAESEHTRLLFECNFPIPRYYLPLADVRVNLSPGTLSTTCAYKGRATHYTAWCDGQQLLDVAWSYPEPLDDATGVKNLLCFYQERLDLFVDGEPVERVRTPWS